MEIQEAERTRSHQASTDLPVRPVPVRYPAGATCTRQLMTALEVRAAEILQSNAVGKRSPY